MATTKNNKVFWQPVLGGRPIPNEGLIHVILDDDQTELVCNASELEASIESGLRPLMYACVCAEYKATFDNGGNRAIDEGYRLTASIMKELEADKKGQA